MSKSKTRQQLRKDGRVIRLSRDVLDVFIKEGNESYDQAFRRMLGLTNKKGQSPEHIYWVLTKPGMQIFESKAKALGASILAMVGRKGERKEAPKKAVIIK